MPHHQSIEKELSVNPCCVWTWWGFPCWGKWSCRLNGCVSCVVRRVWLWLCVVVAVAVVVVFCVCPVWCVPWHAEKPHVCTFKNVPVCTGTKPTWKKKEAWCRYTWGRFERDAFDAYTPSSSLNTQPHTATHNNRAQHNERQSTTNDYKNTQRSQAPATLDCHLSEHETQAKKPTQFRQPKQPTNTSTREHERRDTSPEPRDNRHHNRETTPDTRDNATKKHETCDQSHTRQDKTRQDETRQDEPGEVHMYTHTFAYTKI